MKFVKTRVSRRTSRNPDSETGRDRRRDGLDRESVLDLLVVIDDERRFHAAAAVLATDPFECESSRAKAQEAAALLANVRHGLASIGRRRLSRRERARQIERYASRLMDRSQRPRRYALSSTAHLQGVER